jgi:histone H3/H4
MSDREFGGNDDLSLPKGMDHGTDSFRNPANLNLPKATVQKIINEILAHDDSGVVFAKDTRDLLIECCVEFITLISSEANEIAEKDAKKTIACEHVKTALEGLEFADYVPAIMEVAADYKKQQAVRHSNGISCAGADHEAESREETDQDRAERPERGGAHTDAGRAVSLRHRQIQRWTSVGLFLCSVIQRHVKLPGVWEPLHGLSMARRLI